MTKQQEMGLKGNFAYLPNFIDAKNVRPTGKQEKAGIVYWGRLSHEKGVETLVEAAKELQVKLTIIGDGPLKKKIEEKMAQKRIRNIVLTGFLEGDQLLDKIQESLISVVPSECYENNPISALESFAMGMPVVGARIGGIPELVKDNETGLLFESGNVKDLREKIKQMLSDPDKIAQMGKKARAVAENDFNVATHYKRLIQIYNDAIDSQGN